MKYWYIVIDILSYWFDWIWSQLKGKTHPKCGWHLPVAIETQGRRKRAFTPAYDVIYSVAVTEAFLSRD